MSRRLLVWIAFGSLIWGAVPSLEATEQTTERVSETATIEQTIGRVRARGSGSLSSTTQRLAAHVQIRQLFHSPFFVSGGARVEQERRVPYDLRRWGGDVGLGWAVNDTTDLLATYRLDRYQVFHVGPDVAADFREAAGEHLVTALGLALQRDTRDDHSYPTKGSKTRWGGELALKGLGGDYNFARLESDMAWYVSPFRRESPAHWWQDLTVVEHLRVGWVDDLGDPQDLPFFERYFVGGTSTVRGHRTRWLTPRGPDDQFIGGELELINNVEVRKPIFTQTFDRQLSAAVFFDAGRAFHRFANVGDFGYGIGAGLRYVVHLWKLNGVVRLDYAFNVGREDDDSTGRAHLSFGVPF